ncbi:hypothetical protein KKC91_07510 [bacterium]|nr:hypothetical protein [bacterium]
MFLLWSYSIFTITIFVGIYLLVKYKLKQIKLVFWLFLLPLIGIIGIQIKADKIFSTQLSDININLAQKVETLENKIENLKENMHHYYQQTRHEIFYQKDKDARIKVFPYPTEEAVVVFIELSEIPEKNSIAFGSETGIRSPATYEIFRNVIMYRAVLKPDEVLKEEDDFFEIKYMPDFFTKNKFVSIENIKLKNWTDCNVSVDFMLRDNSDRVIATFSTE